MKIDTLDNKKSLQELFEKIDKQEYQRPFHDSVNLTEMSQKFSSDNTIVEIRNRISSDAKCATETLQRMDFLSKEKIDLNGYNPHDMSLTILTYCMMNCPDRNGMRFVYHIIKQTKNLFWADILI